MSGAASSSTAASRRWRTSATARSVFGPSSGSARTVATSTPAASGSTGVASMPSYWPTTTRIAR
jgi:hypothetical protein